MFAPRALASAAAAVCRVRAVAARARAVSSASAPPPSFRGVFPILATPFHADESLDVEGFRRAVGFMADAGADGVTVVGVLGESNRLVDAERARLVEAAVAVAAEVNAARGPGGEGSPATFSVCVGTSHTGTAGTVALSQMAQELGADAVMVTPSKEPVNADDDLLELYARVEAGCPGLPIVLQDHPGSTQVHMSPALVARIATAVPAVACIKLESLPTPARIAALRARWDAAPPPQGSVSILTGLGALYAGFDMEQGTDGFMTGFAFPEILLAMNNAAQAGDLDLAHRIYHRFLPLMVFEQQPGVAVRKELYRLRGLIDCAHVRLPAKGVAPALAAALGKQIQRSLPGVDVTRPLDARTLEC